MAACPLELLVRLESMMKEQATAIGRNMYYEGQHGAEEPDDTADRLALVKERDALRATLLSIVDADWRTWEELATPDEFVRWAKSRASLVLAGIN